MSLKCHKNGFQVIEHNMPKFSAFHSARGLKTGEVADFRFLAKYFEKRK